MLHSGVVFFTESFYSLSYLFIRYIYSYILFISYLFTYFYLLTMNILIG